MNINFKKDYIYFLIAIIAATLGLVAYILWGNSALESGKRELENSDSLVKSVKISSESEGQKIVTVNCEDGKKYEIYYPAEETNFEAIKTSKCAEI